MKAWVPWAVILLLMVIVGVQTAYSQGLKREVEIAAANERAALDTTRVTLIDSVAAATRLARQASVETDSVSEALSEALQDRDAALVAVQRSEIAFDSVVALGQVAVTDTVIVQASGDTVRVATFTLEGPPISGDQTVRVGAQILLDSRLAVSPFRVSFGVACTDRAPVFTWDTPEWVRPTFTGGTVDPVVCNPPRSSLFSISVGKSVWALAGGVLGYLIGVSAPR